MALSPADFAAYSRATGTPYPEDPEDRAALAPVVRDFRQSQLRQQESGSPVGALAGLASVGLGALGLVLAARRGFGAKAAGGGRKGGITLADLSDPRNAAVSQVAETAVKPSVSTQRTVMPTEAEAMEQYSRQLAEKFPEPTASEMEALSAPSRTSKVLARLGTSPQYRPDPKDINYPRFGPPSPEVAAARREQASQDLLRFAQQRQEDAAFVANQTIGALESGEDQMTGRTMMGAQRNEDLDLASINTVTQQTGSVDVATSLTPDGIPVDQAEGAMAPQEQAQSFLAQKRQELSGTFTPTRAERVLASDPAIAEAAELYASTGDPNVLSRFSSAPSSPLTVKPNVQLSINDPNLSTGQFFKPTGMPEYIGDLIQRDIELTNQISSLGAQQQQLVNKARDLGEQELMLRVAMDRDPSAGGEYTNMFGRVKYEQQNLPDPASLNVDLGDALAERDFVRGQMQSLQDLGSTYKLTDLQEGVRPYYEYDEGGEIIPSTLELRGGRGTADLGPKRGGGRIMAEFDPEGQTGSTKGFYGVEQTDRRSGATTRPTQVTMNELVREGLEQAAASPEGDVPIPPSLTQMTERRPTSSAKRSLEASQIVRQAIIEGRDPQSILRQRGFNV